MELQESEIGKRKEDFYSFGGLNFIKAPYFLNTTSPFG
jgi:hypothetical protein